MGWCSGLLSDMWARWAKRTHVRIFKSHLTLIGDVSHANVKAMNRLVSRVCHLVFLCYVRGVGVILEQPQSSLMFEHPRLKKLLAWIGARESRTSLGAHGALTVKEIILKGTVGWLELIPLRLATWEREYLKTEKEAEELQTYKKYRNASGETKVDGGRDLKPTEAYPLGFGLKIGRLMHEHSGEAVTACPWDTLKILSGSDGLAFEGSLDEPSSSDSDNRDDDCLDDMIDWEGNHCSIGSVKRPLGE